MQDPELAAVSEVAAYMKFSTMSQHESGTKIGKIERPRSGSVG